MSIHSEHIWLRNIPEQTTHAICEKALRYAFYSLPFTVNRMKIDSPEQRLLNIFKGKIAEGLFLEFLKVQGIYANTEKCETPYYLPDKRDFVLSGYEWDIKNNYLLCSDFQGIDTGNLPALIPDRFSGDQWTQREKLLFSESKGLVYVFTFMPLFAANHDLISLQITEDQLITLRTMCNQWNNQHQVSEPYTAYALNNLFFGSRTIEECYQIHAPLQMLITAVAGPLQWQLFYPKLPGEFANGKLKTRIRNRFCHVENLPSFKNLFSSALNKIHWQ
ncbi:MAG: hypothetical protein ACK4GL_01975 [Flavobacteriales bacterium]